MSASRPPAGPAHPTPVPGSSHHGPLGDYRAALKAGDIRPDPSQALAVEKLQSLHRALHAYERRSGLQGWRARLGLGGDGVPPQGLYIYGGVGRGKSMLMDLFFRTAPQARKRRVHFHDFMTQVHARIHELRKWKGQSGGDPIPPVARQLADEATLLCFDEFQVLDITDAMILGRLFEALFEAGVVVVLTSNRPPCDLYKDGLQRDLFLPFIDLIEEKLDILQLAGDVDHRLEYIRRADIFLTPGGEEADLVLEAHFNRLLGDVPPRPEVLEVLGHDVDVGLAGAGVAFTSFDALCGTPLGAVDYLAIARRYHTLILSGIPQISAENRDMAKRFVMLVDALYEHRVTLICSAACEPDALYVDGDGSFEFQRTASRLQEMQSEDYISALHNSGV